jgi:hypothetical protein
MIKAIVISTVLSWHAHALIYQFICDDSPSRQLTRSPKGRSRITIAED